MRYFRSFAWCALAMAVAVPGASTLSAADWYGWHAHRDWQDWRADNRDLRHDYARVDRMRDDIARDRQRLNEDIRCGRSAAAAADARDLARDQQALNAQIRDIQRDRTGIYCDRQNLRRDDYRDSWRGR